MSVHESVFVHPSAIVDDGAHIGAGTKVWHFTHVCAGARIGGGLEGFDRIGVVARRERVLAGDEIDVGIRRRFRPGRGDLSGHSAEVAGLQVVRGERQVDAGRIVPACLEAVEDPSHDAR